MGFDSFFPGDLSRNTSGNIRRRPGLAGKIPFSPITLIKSWQAKRLNKGPAAFGLKFLIF
jgi:hypothetical protein